MPSRTRGALTLVLSFSSLALGACQGGIAQETGPPGTTSSTGSPAAAAPTGELLWSRTYGEGWDDSAGSLVLAEGGSARFLGQGQLDGATDPAEARQLLMEVDGDGALGRHDRIGSSSVYRVGLSLEAVGMKGQHIVAGSFPQGGELAGCALKSPTGFGGQMIAALDEAGACLWATTFAASVTFSSLDVSSTGAILVGGIGKPGASLGSGLTLPVPEQGGGGARFYALYSATGTLLSLSEAGEPGALPIARFDAQGGVILATQTSVTRLGAPDGSSWSWELPAPGGVRALVVAGPSVVMGSWESNQLTLRSLRSSDGGEAWAMAISGASDTDLGPIGLGGSDGGNVVLAAHFAGEKTISLGGTKLTGTGKDNLFWALIDGSGSVLRSRVVPVGGTIYARDAATDANGDVWVLGTFTGSVDFGDGLHPGHPMPPPVKPLDPTGYDVFLARYH